MAKNPDPDSLKRAADLREEIERLKRGGTPDTGSSEGTAGKRPMSPREFIHKRMAELDKKDK
jgi:hypothetical protein